MIVLKTKGYLKFTALLCAAVVLCSCENPVSPDENQAVDTSGTAVTTTQTEAYHYAETLNYDLFSGKKIERFSDLFYEGEEFVPDINKSIADWINQYLLNNYDIVQKQDFSGLMGDPRLFTINGIILETDNPYFTCAPLLNYSDKNGHSIVSRYRDVKELIIEKYQDCIYDYYPNGEWETAYISENGDIYRRTTG